MSCNLFKSTPNKPIKPKKDNNLRSSKTNKIDGSDYNCNLFSFWCNKSKPDNNESESNSSKDKPDETKATEDIKDQFKSNKSNSFSSGPKNLNKNTTDSSNGSFHSESINQTINNQLPNNQPKNSEMLDNDSPNVDKNNKKEVKKTKSIADKEGFEMIKSIVKKIKKDRGGNSNINN